MENNKTIVFCCEGNPYCQKCHGNGTYEIENKIEIIKTFISQKDLAKEKESLDEYLHKEPEKMYVSSGVNKKKKKRKKEKIIIKIAELKKDGTIVRYR